ncbi:class IV adenylate cyclase [Actinorugispora endophytica]|uniref:class IV adenylate cyclase n=1 Tax=Actinorugispora endophytica TaxID=1605990 RepID=UPI00105B2F16|nr:CYTH domain-containing protein [Actinorugispora endophytica]
MREIEAKYRVKDVEALLVVLKSHGLRIGDPVHQDDQAYAQPGWDYGMPKTGVVFARLRTTDDGRHLFTVKKPVSGEMDCIEHETVVTDREQMHDAIVEMGFRPTVRIVKTRRSGSLGSVSVCVDEVEHAGAFVEVEMTVGDDRDGMAAQAELDKVVRAWGVDVERTTDTYDSLVRAATATA